MRVPHTCLQMQPGCWCREGPGRGGSKRRGHLVAAIVQRKLDCRGWRLVVTGHSLGAGAAALIAMRLHGRFPGAPPPLRPCRHGQMTVLSWQYAFFGFKQCAYLLRHQARES